ncbi:MAG: NapC/NirT family cytochrome c [Mycobacterium leprae]
MPTWVQRTLIAVGVLLGLYLVAAFALQTHATARLIGNPTTCGTCHFMDPQVASYQASDHKEVGCLACHSEQNFFKRPLDELKYTYRDVKATLTKSEPETPQLAADEREAMIANCYGCHKEVVQNLHQDRLENCLNCHRHTPHDRPARLANIGG